MFEMCEEDSFIFSLWKTRRKYLCLLIFIIVLLVLLIAYAKNSIRLQVTLPAFSMTNTKIQTKQTISSATSVQAMTYISNVMAQFRKYITTTAMTTEGIQYNLTQVTKQTLKKAPNIHRSITHELDLKSSKEGPGERGTSDYLKNHFITISFKGRLGNLMFQLAALISCANRINYTAFIRPNELINSYFLYTRTSNMRLTNARTFYEDKFAKYDSNIENLDTTINWTLSGYFQSWKYFYEDEVLIRRSFKFKSDIYKPAYEFVEGFRKGNKTIVGIHIRKGDMTTKTNEKIGYTTAPITYINKSMNYFRDRYNDTYFIIISDDIAWCKENIRGNNDIAVSRFKRPGIDMAILSFCDHVIITTGTFGWWGAWLAGGEVVYFKGFPRPGSDIDKGMSREDYYPSHWNGME